MGEEKEIKKEENAGKSEKVERDRAYEQVLQDYFSGVNVHRYARSEEDIDGIRRELPPWDIMPPQEDF